MAEAIVGAIVGDAVSKLSDVTIHAIKKSFQFRSTLTQLQETITKIKPIYTEIEVLNKVLDRPTQETKMFIDLLKEAEELVRKCEHVKWYSYKAYRHSLKLEDLNKSLLRFFQIDVQLQADRDVKEVLMVVKDVQERMEKGISGGWSSGVPLLKGDVIGFDDRLRALKAMVLKDSVVDDCSVVVVSAVGGCGKTTLVTKLCHDPQIQAKFGRNIYFATISETPNIKVVIKNLLQKNQGGQQLDFASDEEATRQWGIFLGENRSEVLLVLDDVWDASIVMKFKFNSGGYKILVTSRCIFKQFNTYQLQLLNDQDATNLFRHSAFSIDGSEHTDIPDDLITEMVKCCKNHPLSLCVIGGLLRRKNMTSWLVVLKKLSAGKQSVLDVDKSIQFSLMRSLDVLEEKPAIKQCYLDLGLFPEDHKIAATMLMDMWVHLYNHDENGLDTLTNLFELSSKNLATLLQEREDSPAIANFCEEKVVLQHKMMRELAIYLSNQEPEEERGRLIINANGEDLPQLPQTVDARLLSISTDERFSMRWNDFQVPNVEVFVLNFMSKIYVLPRFMQNMESLKVLIIINYGYYSSELQNFPAPQYLSGLTSIRLENISISLISTSILELVNLQKLSLIMCKIGNSFNECTINGIPNKLPSLLEIEMDSCDDLVTFPAMLCNLVRLKKLGITNCLELISLSEGFGSLTNLEVLRLASCSNLRLLPESVGNLQKLSIIDLNYCLHLSALPPQIGELGSLRTIHMRGCTGVYDLPSSVKDLCPLEVVCDEEISLLWSHFTNVKIQVVEEDTLSTLSKIIPGGIEESHPASEPNSKVIDTHAPLKIIPGGIEESHLASEPNSKVIDTHAPLKIIPGGIEESHPSSEPNSKFIDAQFFSRDKTKSFSDYLQQAALWIRMKDFCQLIWFYPVKKEAEVNFGSLVDRFSLLAKYIRRSVDPSLDANYLMEIQTLLQDIQEHLEAPVSDIVAFSPKGLVTNTSFWSDIPEVHASAITSAGSRALRCIKDLKFKKLGISGNGAKQVAERLKGTPELRRGFDMVLCVPVTDHSIEQLMNNIEEEILLWKKKSSETGNKINVPDEFLNCLLFIDYGDNLVNLHEIERLMSYRYHAVQIVMASELQNFYFQVDLEIRIQDHLLPWILFSKHVDLAKMGKYPSIQLMATLLVEKCHGHLLAIILLARALRGVVDVTVWELASQELALQQEPSSSESSVISDVMVRILRFVWSRMEILSQRCIIHFALHYRGAEFKKSSLIHTWIRDGLVKGEQEGEHVFEDLIRSFLLEPAGETYFRMRDETRVTLVAYFVPHAYGLHLKQDGSESNKMPNVEEWDAREIHLTNNILSELPDTPNCPMLVKLLLNSNQDLMDISITFFDHMPSLQVLNFSSTSIKHLPSSISKLTSLQQLIVRDCDLLMELPPQIGELTNLKVFDSQGTQLISLPEQFGFLTKLECLKFSLYSRADRYRQSKQIMHIIPAEDLSKLIWLKELSICMDSYGEWWEDETKLIINILCQVRNLESLKLYFPTTGLLRTFMEQENREGIPIYPNLSNFSFIVGRLQQRVISRLPRDLDNRFLQLPKCLKYTNGDGDTKVIAMAVKYVHALFLDRHSTIQSLSTFGAVEMKRLKFCVLAECNKMLEIVDGSCFYEVGGNGNEGFYEGTVLGSLEYLAVHYMKSLNCIWKGPIHSGCLAKLKTLVIHVCPELRTILTQGMIGNLTSLEYLMVENCANINSIVSSGSYHSKSTWFLPKLKNISLLHLPKLESISSGISIAPRLESLVIYGCPKLKQLSSMEVCDDIKEIKGGKEWWDALKWCQPEWSSGQLDYLASVFIPLGIDDDIMNGLADDVDFLPHLSY